MSDPMEDRLKQHNRHVQALQVALQLAETVRENFGLVVIEVVPFSETVVFRRPGVMAWGVPRATYLIDELLGDDGGTRTFSEMVQDIAATLGMERKALNE